MRILILLSALFVSLSGLVAGDAARAGQAIERSVGGAAATLASVRSAVLAAPHRALIPVRPPADVAIVRTAAAAPTPPVAGAEARLRV